MLAPSLEEVARLEFRYFFLHDRSSQAMSALERSTYVDAVEIILKFLHVVMHGGVLFLIWKAFVDLDVDGGRILVLVHIRVNLRVMGGRRQ